MRPGDEIGATGVARHVDANLTGERRPRKRAECVDEKRSQSEVSNTSMELRIPSPTNTASE